MFSGGRHRHGEGGNPLLAVLAMIVAPIAAMLIELAVSGDPHASGDRRAHARLRASVNSRPERRGVRRRPALASSNGARKRRCVFLPSMSTPVQHALSESLAGAARAVSAVLDGHSLTGALTISGRRSLDAAIQDLSFATLRDYGVGDALLARLLRQPLSDVPLRALLLVALRALAAARATDYTVVSEAVNAATALGLARAKGLVNGVLRSYLRDRAALDAAVLVSDAVRHRHPQWWIDRLRRDHPDAWGAVLDAGNARPPMTLRVNRRRLDAAAYAARLAQAGIASTSVGEAGLLLDHPCPVSMLPGFEAGEVSVQDASAQRAAALLDMAAGQRVLDACAAPGGKAAHILETADVELVALDADAARTARIGAGFARLGLHGTVVTADAADLPTWFDGRAFDRVLLDAPCTASGVVRRHPDIKWLRRSEDVAAFARQQDRLLDALWQVLAPDGRMLYATCSVFREENADRIDAFLVRHADATALPVPGGAQWLPDAAHDGFFYALLAKAR
jgi:16S rRNA (cytosine967-C5)-methyltransferase